MSKVVITYDNIMARIDPVLPQESLKYLDDKSKYRLKGYDRTWNFKKGLWDGYTHAFDFFNQTFRVGLLRRMRHALEFLKYEVEENYVGKIAESSSRLTLKNGVIRPYSFQDEVRNVVRTKKRGIIESPTGTGKTVMTAMILDTLRKRTLVIVNELVLLDQMYRNLKRTLEGAEIGYIGNQEFSLGDVTVATVQSLTSILGLQKKETKEASRAKEMSLREWLESCEVIVHDEAHLADADTCVALYGQFVYADHVYGFSATPFAWAEKQQKSGNIELEQIFGGIIYSTFENDFIEMGLKVPCIIKQVEVPFRIEKYGTYRDNQSILYKKALKFEILESDEWVNEVKNQVEEFKRDNMTSFVYASHSIEYGEKLAKALGAPFVQGKTPRAKRFEIFDAIQEKKIPCIVSDIGGIGLDIPSLDSFILASDVQDIRQMRGRVERSDPASGKKFGHFVDLWKRCSFLKKHHDLRVNQYEKDGNIIH